MEVSTLEGFFFWVVVVVVVVVVVKVLGGRRPFRVCDLLDRVFLSSLITM